MGRIILNIYRNPIIYFAAVLFLLMLCAPFEYVILKVGLMIIVLSSIAYSWLKSTASKLSSPVLIWCLSWIGWGVFFSIVGLLNPLNNPDFIIKALPVNVLWPVVYMIFISGISEENDIRILIKISIFAILIISLYTIGAALNILGLISVPFISFDMAKQALDMDEGLLKVFVPSTTSLLFLIPFLMTFILLDSSNYLGIKKIYLFGILFLSVIAVLATARRALLLNILISPIILVTIIKLIGGKLDPEINRKMKKTFFYLAIVMTLGIIIISLLGILDLGAVFTKFLNGFDFSSNTDDEGSNLRSEQSGLLLKSFYDYPILGAGHGAVSEYVVRSEETPWVYELSYFATLFQTGLFGFLIYIYLLFSIFQMGSRYIVKTTREFGIYLLACLVGLASFLLANATNPYLIAYDHMWVLFLPLSIINLLIVKGRNA